MSETFTEIAGKAVKKHHPTAVALSNDLAAHPECAGEEFESSRKIVELLKKAGYAVEFPFCGYETAFNAVLDNGGGPSVAILTEYDALPEIGHACGHNIHGSMSVLAALALMDLKEHFKGKLFIIGTPAEEIDGAKVGMADKGVFDNLDLAMMFHSFPRGVSQPTMNLLALKGYDFIFKGQTSHAAVAPWSGRNALAAARKFLDLVDARRQGFTSDVRFNGIFTEGGKAPNIIPDYAQLRTEIRADSIARVEAEMEGIVKCARGAALALDCEVEWKPYMADFADMVCNKPAEDAMQKILEGLGVTVSPMSPPVGSSDMGNASYRCPSIQPLLAITKDPSDLHTLAFAQATLRPEAHEALRIGGQALASLTLEVMNDKKLRDDIRGAFQKEKEIKSRL